MPPIVPFYDQSGLESSSIFHYTSADVGVLKILRRGELRIGPIEYANDPRESKARHIGVQGKLVMELAHDEFEAIQAAADHAMRGIVKLACFTRDFQPPAGVPPSDGRPGWSHPALWAHYASRHAGVCLRFDRAALLDAVASARPEGATGLAGPVRYVRNTRNIVVPNVPYETLSAHGFPTTMRVFAEDYAAELFFSKHVDWSYEAEYRILVMCPEVAEVFVPVEQALTGIFLGPDCPDDLRREALEIANIRESLEVFDMVGLGGDFEPVPALDSHSAVAPVSAGTAPNDTPAVVRQDPEYRDVVAAYGRSGEQLTAPDRIF